MSDNITTNYSVENHQICAAVPDAILNVPDAILNVPDAILNVPDAILNVPNSQ